MDFYITSVAKTLKKQQLQSITVTTRDVLGNYRFTVFRSCTETIFDPLLTKLVIDGLRLF